MKRKVLVFIVSLLILTSVVGVVMATTAPTEATVTVNEIIDVTITDLDTSGVTFGNFNPGTSNNAAAPNPAVTITVETTTNVDVNVYLKGADWAGDATLTLADTNVRYDDDNIIACELLDQTTCETTTGCTWSDPDCTGTPTETGWTKGVLTTSYETAWDTVTAPCGTGAVTTSVHHWLDVPANQHAGAYTSTFTYRGDSS